MKCKYYYPENGYGDKCKSGNKTRCPFGSVPCSRAIPDEPKPRYRKIRAWANPSIAIEAGKCMCWIVPSKSKNYSIPLTIVIDERYLKERKPK